MFYPVGHVSLNEMLVWILGYLIKIISCLKYSAMNYHLSFFWHFMNISLIICPSIMSKIDADFEGSGVKDQTENFKSWWSRGRIWVLKMKCYRTSLVTFYVEFITNDKIWDTIKQEAGPVDDLITSIKKTVGIL